MSLYVMEATFDVVVDAKTKKEARKLAEDKIYEEIHQSQQTPLKTSIRKVINISDLSGSWAESVPWSIEDHEKTCLEILMNIACVELVCHNCKGTTNLVRYKQKIACKTCFHDSLKEQNNAKSNS